MAEAAGPAWRHVLRVRGGRGDGEAGGARAEDGAAGLQVRDGLVVLGCVVQGVGLQRGHGAAVAAGDWCLGTRASNEGQSEDS